MGIDPSLDPATVLRGLRADGVIQDYFTNVQNRKYNLMQFSNPRTEATVNDWPSGSRRVTAIFSVESNNRGERVSRTTTGKPKTTVYYKKIRIVDREIDGRIFLIALTQYSNAIVIIPGTLQGDEYLYEGDQYEQCMALLNKE